MIRSYNGRLKEITYQANDINKGKLNQIKGKARGYANELDRHYNLQGYWVDEPVIKKDPR